MSKHKFKDGDGQNKIIEKNASYIISTNPFKGTLAEMAADALKLTPSDEGKRWQATDDNDKIYSYGYVDDKWDYYPEPQTTKDGSIVISPYTPVIVGQKELSDLTDTVQSDLAVPDALYVNVTFHDLGSAVATVAYLVFNADDAADAALKLANTSIRKKVVLGDAKPFHFTSDSPVTNIYTKSNDAAPVGGSNMLDLEYGI